MKTLKRVLQPRAYYAVLALIGVALVTLGVTAVGYVHGARASERETCARAARALIQSKPFLRSTLQSPDACRYLRRLQGEDV